MKRLTLIILIFLFSANAIDAQWYNRKCDIIDINNCTGEEFKCLQSHSVILVVTGAVVTTIGTVFIVSGIHRLSEGGIEAGYEGAIAVILGSVIDAIGITPIIVGSVRISQLKKIPNYDNLKTGSLNLSPVFGTNQFNSTYYFGMSLSLNF